MNLENQICCEVIINTKTWYIQFSCKCCQIKTRNLSNLLAHFMQQHLFLKDEDLLGLLEKQLSSVTTANVDVASIYVNDDEEEEELINKHELVHGYDSDEEYESQLEQVVDVSTATSEPVVLNDCDSAKEEELTEAFNNYMEQLNMEIDQVNCLADTAKQTSTRDQQILSYLNCDKCNLSFCKRSNYRMHMRTVHSELKLFECDFCGIKFTEKQNLNQHHLRHMGIKKFLCSICGKNFITSSELKTHIRFHTNEKPFQCLECDKAYQTSGKLNEHIRQHRAELQFGCSMCGKRFNKRSNWRYHEASHKNQKSYKCVICNRNYRQRTSLLQHMKNHDAHSPQT